MLSERRENMRGHYLIAVWIASVAVAGAQGQQAGKASSPPTTAATAAPAPAGTTSNYGLTPADKARKNPVQFTKDSVTRGQGLYDSQCAMCHGKNGNGKGDLAVALKMNLSDFTKPEALAHYSDGELFKILSVGNAIMPGQAKRLSDTQLWNIVNFLRATGGGVPSVASLTKK
jgi:mono/diheme cytochrome c family protein